MVADSHIILGRWRKHLSQLLNIHGVNVGRQTEIHTGEPLVSGPGAFNVEMAIEKLKSHKSPGTVQITADLIKAWGRRIGCEIHKLITSVWNKEELPEEFIIVPIHEKDNKTDCGNHRGILLLPSTYKILSNILLSKLTPYNRGNYWGSSMWISTQQLNY